MCTINTLCAQSAHYVHNQKSAYQLHLPADVDQYGEADYCKGYVQWKSGRHLLVSLIIIISMISINTITDILLQKMPFLDQRHKFEMVIPKILELLFSNIDRALWGENPDRLKNESFFGDQINHHHHHHLQHVHLWVRDANRNESLHRHPYRAVHWHCQADLKEVRWDLRFLIWDPSSDVIVQMYTDTVRLTKKDSLGLRIFLIWDPNRDSIETVRLWNLVPQLCCTLTLSGWSIKDSLGLGILEFGTPTVMYADHCQADLKNSKVDS